jgi:hypothetical protein
MTEPQNSEQSQRQGGIHAMPSAESQLAAELADAMLLQRISVEMTAEENIQSLYEKILDAAMAIMRSDFASMQMFYPERGTGGELRLLAFRGFNPERQLSGPILKAPAA